MKVGAYGLKGKEASLISIFLLCTTIIIWSWEKTPDLNVSITSHTPVQLPPENLLSSSVVSVLAPEPPIHVDVDDSPSANKKTAIEPEELHLNIASQTVPAQSYSGREEGNTEILSSASGEEAITEAKRNEDEEKTSTQEENRPDFAIGSPQRISLISGKDGAGWNNATANKVCNFARGKWVPDNRHPLYSGFGCKQWLSEMWACRLTQRTDFAYEKFRWQPKDCQMEEFERSKFFRRLLINKLGRGIF